jgi:hypothetical protein
MKAYRLKKTGFVSGLLLGFLLIYTAQATPTTFTGAYSQNFDSALAGSSTTIPAGFRSMVIAGGNTTYSASSLIATTGIASATVSSSQTLTVWNAGSAMVSSGTSLFNLGSVGNANDRALGTDPTGTAANIIELSMTNNTGYNLQGVSFSYDDKCLTNGSVGTEQSELPGYAFFYSTTGGTNATDWTEVSALSLGNYTQGTTFSSATINLTFTPPLTNKGIMYFRWADDNNQANSPDQMNGIDNISIPSYLPVTDPGIAIQPASTVVYPGAAALFSVTATGTTPFSFQWQATNSGTGTFTNLVDGGQISGAISNVLTISAVNSYWALSYRVIVTNNLGAVTSSPAATLTVLPASVLINCDLGTTVVQAGAAVLGQPGNIWNAISNTSVNPLITANGTVLNGSGLLLANASQLYVDAGGTAMDLATSNLMTDYAFGYNVSGYTPTVTVSLTGLNPYTNSPFILVIYAAGDTSGQGGSLTLTGATGGNSANTLTTTATSRQISAGLGVAYNTFTGILTNGTLNFTATELSGQSFTVVNGFQLQLGSNRPPNVPLAVFPAANSIGVTNHPGLNVAVSDPDANNLTVTFYGRVASLGSFGVVGTVTGVPSGGDAFTTWYGLTTNTTYKWYAVVDDGLLTSTDAVSQFTTAAFFPAIPPTVTLTSPAGNSGFSAPATLALTAAAGDADGIVTNVAFYQNTIKLSDVNTSPYTFVWATVPPGSYALTAIATDDNGLMTTSSAVNVSVANSTAVQILQQVKTVFVIALENHNFRQPTPTSSPQQIYANPAAPYLNNLLTPGNPNAAQVSYATAYYNSGVGVHPSEPNYIWAEGGTDFGYHTDNDPTSANGNVFNAPHLTRQLTAAGIPWKDYQEDLQLSASPTNSASGTSGTTINPYYGTGDYAYAVKHNPPAFYTDTQTQNVFAFTNFLRDLANRAVGRYNWITPNLFNDQHNPLASGFTYHGVPYTGDQAAIAQGDNFLATLVPQIMTSAEYQDHGVIILWWDEAEGGDTTSYTIPEIVLSPMAKGNAYASSVELNHSSDLKTMEEIFGLGFLTNAVPAGETKASGSGYNNVATVNDLGDLFRGIPGLGVQQSGATLTNGVNASVLGTVAVGASVTNTFSVTNTGLGTLTLSNLVVSGAQAGDYRVDGIALPALVTAGGSTTFNLVFSPAACGATVATVLITNNDQWNNPFTLSLAGTGDAVPMIEGQPVNQTNYAGTGATFSVGAAACSALNYQWYFGTNVLTGETNSSLSIASVGMTNVGYYSVVVTNSVGCTNSDPASLTVIYQAPNVVGGQLMLGAGGFNLVFSGPAGQTYQVLASDQLTLPRSAWTVIGSGTFVGTNVVLTDADAANHPHRYYLIRSP